MSTTMGSSYRRGLQGKALQEGVEPPTFDVEPTEGPVTALEPGIDMNLVVARASARAGRPLSPERLAELGLTEEALSLDEGDTSPVV